MFNSVHLQFAQMKLLIALIIQIQALSLNSASNLDVLTNLNDFKVAAKRVKRSGSDGACIHPPVMPDKSYTLKFPPTDRISNAIPGQAVPQFTSITSECNTGYAADIENNYKNVYKPEISFCVSGAWVPPILQCKKICDNIPQISKVDITCHRHLNGPAIPCTSNLLEGAITKPRCQKHHSPNHKYATCGANGRWGEGPFKCRAVCGRFPDNVGLIQHGIREVRGGSPWHVAIYSSESSPKPVIICGGTLITAELVISAAHCFYNPTFRKTPDIKNYYAVVGKMIADFENDDFSTTKKLRVKKIIFPVDFNEALTNFAADIVILQLSERVNFSSDVFPACLDRGDRIHFDASKNKKGKLSGFGDTENSSYPSVLLSAELPAFSYNECLTKVDDDTRKAITLDKFCAGTKDGVGAGRGDSGGGLLFMDNASKLYHLRGVVSNRVATSVVTFTDVARHMPWISNILKSFEHESEDSETESPIEVIDESPEPKINVNPVINGEILYKECKSNNQFRCASGRCIDQNLKCNGKRDCDDGTDEKTDLCENNQCSANQFRCRYGACIDLKFKCDLSKECPDGSDEFPQLCRAGR